MAEPVEPGLPIRRPGALDLPAQEQLRGHMVGTLIRREGGELPQFPNRTGRQAGAVEQVLIAKPERSCTAGPLR